MNQLSVPLERPPQFDMQPSAFSDPSGDSNNLNAFAPPGLSQADAISTWPAQAQNPDQGGNQAGLFSGFASTLGFGGIGPLVQQLMGLLQQLVQMLSGSGTSPGGLASGGPIAAGSEEYFRQAAGSSAGDPHLSFNGTDGANHLETSRFDSMTDHPDLLDSNSFRGGYRISTQVTSPNANGVTLNQSATLSTNFGRTRVSLDGSGNATITRCGQPVSITAGQTLDLGNGQTVTENVNGSLTIVNTAPNGGKISTTLATNAAGGVDVSADATGVNLGGDLVAEAQRTPQFWFPPLPNNLRVSAEPPPQFGPQFGPIRE